MLTRLSSAAKEVLIGEGPTVLIGERINPTGKKKLAAALMEGDMDVVRASAIAQVQAGADVLDVNVGVAGLDQVKMLPIALKTVMDAVDVPISIDSNNPEVLQAALKVYKGKPLINSITGEEKALASLLPLVKEYGTAFIGLTMDDEGIPTDVEKRVAIAHKIVDRAVSMGIPQEDVVIDCLVMTVATDHTAAAATLEAVRRVRAELGQNITAGVSNVSFGLPERDVINSTFLSLMIAAGVNCPIIDVAKVRPLVLATDMLLGRDEYSARYIKAFRERQKALEAQQAAQQG
ncbi:MAG TPA: dihydropteroate synthase [Dehalococcoidia bacterium]|nr:dihydropteroate synthase [Dehalococcoidia bacterium]